MSYCGLATFAAKVIHELPALGKGASTHIHHRKGGGKDEMAQGTVKWFSQEKGYGFITPDEGGEDIFVHYTGIAGSGFRTLEDKRNSFNRLSTLLDHLTRT